LSSEPNQNQKIYFYILDLTDKKISLSEDLISLIGLKEASAGWLDYRKWLDRIHPDDRSRADWSIAKASRNDKAIISYRLKTGSEDYLEVTDQSLKLRVKPEAKEYRLGVLNPIIETSPDKRLEQALYEISRLSVETDNLVELLRSIHGIIKKLLPAENFYIALYDQKTGLISFPYFVDEYDQPPLPHPPGKGLTEYVLKTGAPLLASPEVFNRLEAEGKVQSIGAPSVDWLGVPLKYRDEIFGVMVVQSYTEGVRYNQKHLQLLTFVANQSALVIKKNLAEEQRRETEKLLIDSFASIQDGISILDLELNIIQVNPAMEKWYAHAMPLVGKKCHLAYHGRNSYCHPCPSLRTLKTKAPANDTVPKIGPGGEITGWLELFAFPLIDNKTGQLKGVIEYARDISDRKKAEDALKASLREKEILLKEVHHRVKNNMQIISSLLNLQAGYLKDPEARTALRECQNRIHSMALVHERLYREKDLASIDFREYAEHLLIHLFQIFSVQSAGLSYSLSIESPPLTVDLAIPLGLILTELVTNSLQHAFSPGQKGRIEVSFLRKGPDFLLQVTDDGRGFQPPVQNRFGLEIVNLLATQLGGKFNLKAQLGRGTTAIVSFPAGENDRDNNKVYGKN